MKLKKRNPLLKVKSLSPRSDNILRNRRNNQAEIKDLEDMKNRLFELYNEHSLHISFYHAFNYSISLFSKNTREKLIAKEIELIHKGESTAVCIKNSLKKREEYLNELYLPGSLQEKLKNLRSETLHLIEYLAYFNAKMPTNFDDLIAYFLYLIQKDSETISNVQNVQFLKLPDPFLVHCYVKNEKNYDKIPLTESIFTRITEASQFLSSSIPFFELFPYKKKGLRKFCQKLPIEITDTMGNPIEECYISLYRKNPCFLWLKNYRKTEAFIILSIDPNRTAQYKLRISHISCRSISILPDILEFLMNYIWTHYCCQEIRIGLKSVLNDDGKYETNGKIKSMFTDLGFRWKQLIHDGEDTLLILGKPRPADILYFSLKSLPLFNENVFFKYTCYLQDRKETEYEEHPYSPLGLQHVLRDNPDIQTFIPILNKSYPHFKVERCDEITYAICEIGLSWIKHITGICKGTQYVKVFECEVHKLEYKDNTLYLVPTDDENFSVFFIPVQEPFDGNVSEFSVSILSGVSTKHSVLNHIWVPSFEYKRHHYLEIGYEHQAEESVEFKLQFPVHPVGSSYAQFLDNETKLSFPFIFGIVNSKQEDTSPYISLLINK